MEKQKVFWVVLSVSVFVVVVLVAGVLLLRQQSNTGPRATVTPMNGTGTPLYEYQREAPQTPPATGPQAGTPSPQAPGAPGTPGGPGAAPAPASPTAAAPVLAARPAQPQAKPRTPKPALQARASRNTADYWIQTGSYKSQTKAEELVSLLQDKGLGSRVFSWTSKGETFFRVRVGPYSSKGEADKFLALVRQVQGLETSYVSMVRAARTSVN
jgi:cell division protein FtsN